MKTKVRTFTLLACCISTPAYSIPTIPKPSYSSLLPTPDAYDQIVLSKYWVSEKLDGIRALWTGKELRTRKGNKITAPTWFIEGLPKVRVEGELWAGRGGFNQVQKTVLDKVANDKEWSQIRFMLFEVPDETVDFSSRYETLSSIVKATQRNHVQVIEQQPIASYLALVDMLEQVEQRGGEGLMLKHVSSINSDTVKPIKIKKHMDSEGVIIGYKQGNGKYRGMLGSIVVKLENGRLLSIGSGLSDTLRTNPPALGELVTFRHNGYTSTGLPRFARFTRIRKPE